VALRVTKPAQTTGGQVIITMIGIQDGVLMTIGIQDGVIMTIGMTGGVWDKI